MPRTSSFWLWGVVRLSLLGVVRGAGVTPQLAHKGQGEHIERDLDSTVEHLLNLEGTFLLRISKRDMHNVLDLPCSGLAWIVLGRR